MRCSLIVAWALLANSAFGAVGPDGALINSDFQQCLNLDCSLYPTYKFHLGEKTLSGSTVYGEPFYVEVGAPASHKTIFTPSKIKYVFNPVNGQVFEPGVDYIGTEQGIKLTPNTRMTGAPSGFSSTMTEQEKTLYKVRVSNEFQKYQYAITYDKSEKFAPLVIGTLGKLKSSDKRAPMNITFFGDSITYGESATEGVSAPFQPGYAGLVMSYLNAISPGTWNYRNNSVAGWNTFNAASAASYRVADKPSDLVVLGFGMNDSNFVTTNEYKENLVKVISIIREKQPKVPILLVSGTVANPESTIQNHDLLMGYRTALKEITQQYPLVAVSDVTQTWNMMLENKRYLDLTGNGLNHPNDFGHRVIAEAVLSAILGQGY
ncbi:SGNH/GDSL hydrolase family protein [Pseudomonas fluorescens]|uniref:SGNH/GDSL hydrolase family protein n=1 Tax=Pseudomonas fluorescens TaxID=294 RepID=UPI003525DB3D